MVGNFQDQAIQVAEMKEKIDHKDISMQILEKKTTNSREEGKEETILLKSLITGGEWKKWTKMKKMTMEKLL
jgi:hypothetical protein